MEDQQRRDLRARPCDWQAPLYRLRRGDPGRPGKPGRYPGLPRDRMVVRCAARGLSQFVGKTGASPLLRVGSDIRNISGATLSSMHITVTIEAADVTVPVVRRCKAGVARGECYRVCPYAAKILLTPSLKSAVLERMGLGQSARSMQHSRPSQKFTA